MTSTGPQPNGPYSGSTLLAPPNYSSLSVANPPLYPSTVEYDIASILTSEGPSPPLRTHEYHLSEGANATPWATLHLSSTAPRNAHRPRYIGGDDVSGTVNLNLKNASAISSIRLLLRGTMITSSLVEGSYRFLEESIPIWDKSTNSPPVHKENGKLVGKYEWPFSFPFPTEYIPPTAGASPANKGSTACPVPQTLMQKNVSASVVYEVVLRIVSGIFKRKFKLQTSILYIPLNRSAPLLEGRKNAYKNGAFIPGPLADPDGWTKLPDLEIAVTRRRKSVGSSSSKTGASSAGPQDKVICSIYIGNPTEYARGSVIPCYLMYGNGKEDAELIQAFKSQAQRCLKLELKQSLTYFQNPQQAMSGAVFKLQKSGHSNSYTVGQVDIVGEAVWWDPPYDAWTTKGPENKLEGEIHLDKELFPSTKASFLLVEYVVSASLVPSEDLEFTVLNDAGPEAATSSKSVDTPTKDLSTHGVVITTVNADGPMPIPFTPVQPKIRRPDQVVDVEYLVPGPTRY
ncbi:hypothetical protein FA15DRAFT_633020 [Coprinopsis marcescibilis]|uniref:Arrestin-like N-terminal domain-containing protein n=1 Tax=Coprinopsis marcescibilis TaxID=230819 RepID=A0A5C3LK60_COPMA|nr:hypothetical protein FA15DRAFT_633020 [Coprinopsis marcescibilis]